MHRYEELEKLYYKKKYKKIIYIIVLICCIFLLGFFIYKKFYCHEKKQTVKINIDFKKIIENNNSETDKIIKKLKKKVKKSQISKHNLQSKKSVNNNKKIQQNIKQSNIPTLSFIIPQIKKPLPVKKDIVKKNIVKKVTVKKIKSAKSVNIPVINKIQTIPVIQENNINVSVLIKNFNNSPSYDEAIAISQYFFNKKDYIHAKLWALKANNIDPSKYQSWQMFAMILLKKNDKIQAEKVLKAYLDDYGYNKQIDKLLRSIDE